MRRLVGRERGTAARLTRAISLIDKYSKSLNLTGSVGMDGLWKQAGEAVAAVVAVERSLGRELSVADRWLDVGSGGGFPGLVVASCVPADLFLLEPRAKRAAFLEMGLASLGGTGRRVMRGRLESGGLEGLAPADSGALEAGGSFRILSARAVFAPDLWVERARVLAATESVVVLHLGCGDAPPAGVRELARVDFDRWSVAVVTV